MLSISVRDQIQIAINFSPATQRIFGDFIIHGSLLINITTWNYFLVQIENKWNSELNKLNILYGWFIFHLVTWQWTSQNWRFQELVEFL